MMPDSSKIIDSEMMQIQLDQLSQTLEVMSGTVQRLQRQVSVYESASQARKEPPVATELFDDLGGGPLKGEGYYQRRSRQSSKHRQAARIIKHLSEDIQRVSPALAVPSGRVIECLIKSCPSELIDGSNWQLSISRVLDCLSEATAAGDGESFTCHDHSTPLFPNQEGFDEQDCHLFCESLLTYLATELQITH